MDPVSAECGPLPLLPVACLLLPCPPGTEASSMTSVGDGMEYGTGMWWAWDGMGWVG